MKLIHASIHMWSSFITVNSGFQNFVHLLNKGNSVSWFPLSTIVVVRWSVLVHILEQIARISPFSVLSLALLNNYNGGFHGLPVLWEKQLIVGPDLGIIFSSCHHPSILPRYKFRLTYTLWNLLSISLLIMYKSLSCLVIFALRNYGALVILSTKVRSSGDFANTAG